MTARSHTRTMHKQKKRRAVANLRWRLRISHGPKHKASKGVGLMQQGRQEQLDMMEKGYRYTDDY